MKQIFTFILYTLFIQASFSQNNLTVFPKTTNRLKGSLSGTVTDAKTGQLLVNASVTVTDLKTGAATDNMGRYNITNIPEGKHLIEVSSVGYASHAETVDINGSTVKDFQLSETAVENNEVVVTGTSSASKVKWMPVPVTVVKKDELLQAASSNIIDALAKQPGVSVLSTGPNIAKPVIRGLGYNRVVVINDGIRQEGQQWGDEHGIEIDEASVSKVEILKGPGSVMYGSDAMAGVVNIITNVPVASNTMSVKYLGNWQSNNKMVANNFQWAGNVKGFNWNMYLSGKSASDYRNKYDDYVFNSKFREQNWGGYAGYNSSKGYSHLLISRYHSTPGIIEGERDADGDFVKPIPGGAVTKAVKEDFLSRNAESYFPHQQITHFKISTDNSYRLAKGKISIVAGYQQNTRNEFANADNPVEKELGFVLKTYTGNILYHVPENNGWKISLGISGMRQLNSNNGTTQLIPNYSITDAGGFVYAQKRFAKLTLSTGARYDARELKTENLLDENGNIKTGSFSKSFSNVSGSAGFSYEADDKLVLKLNLAKGFRAPNVSELASNGNHEGTFRYEYGNQNLKNENSLQVDGGFEFATDHLSFSAAAFYNSFSNFIFYGKLLSAFGGDSLVNVNGAGVSAYKFNRQKAILSGLEITFDVHPHPLDWLHFENTISIVNGRFKNKTDFTYNMPLIPAGKWVSELRGDFKKVDETPLRNLYIKLELDNNFAQEQAFTAYNTETKTPGYSLLNIGAGTGFVNKKGETVLSVHLAGNNITDVGYQSHLSRLKYAPENNATGRRGVYNMGRNFSIKVLVPLVFKLINK